MPVSAIFFEGSEVYHFLCITFSKVVSPIVSPFWLMRACGGTCRLLGVIFNRSS